MFSIKDGLSDDLPKGQNFEGESKWDKRPTSSKDLQGVELANRSKSNESREVEEGNSPLLSVPNESTKNLAKTSEKERELLIALNKTDSNQRKSREGSESPYEHRVAMQSFGNQPGGNSNEEKREKNSRTDLGNGIHCKIDPTSLVGPDSREPYKKKVFERLTWIKIVLFTNIIASVPILTYFMIITSIWRQQKYDTFLGVEIATSIVSDVIALSSWLAFFFSLYRKSHSLLKKDIYVTLASFVLKAISLAFHVNSTSRRKLIEITFCIDLSIKFVFMIVYWLVSKKMEKTTPKGWRKAWRRKKKIYEYTW